MTSSLLISALCENYRLMAEALIATRRAIIIASATGIMLLCTGPAEDCLERYFETSFDIGQELPETLRAWACLQKSIPSGNGNPPETQPPLILDREAGRLTVHLIHSQVKGQFVLMMEEQTTGPAIIQLQHQLGLTPREAEVLLWVSHGKMNADIAILLGLKTATVEKHLEHIFTKLRVETRTAAARCANESLNGKPLA